METYRDENSNNDDTAIGIWFEQAFLLVEEPLFAFFFLPFFYLSTQL